jgi:hypothetical protein
METKPIEHLMMRVNSINSDLSAEFNITEARTLAENIGLSHIGTQKNGNLTSLINWLNRC